MNSVIKLKKIGLNVQRGKMRKTRRVYVYEETYNNVLDMAKLLDLRPPNRKENFPFFLEQVHNKLRYKMKAELREYIVWKCPACNKWQGKQNNKFTIGMSEVSKSECLKRLTLKCISEKCGKSVKFKDNVHGGIRVLHYWCKLPQEATRLIQQFEKRKSEARQDGCKEM